MNQLRNASAVLFLLCATVACAAEPRQEPQPQQQEEPKAKPDKDAAREKDAKPNKREEAKPAEQEKPEKADAKKDESRPAKQEKPENADARKDQAKPAEQEKQEKTDAKKDDQSQPSQNQHPGKSARIPDDKFHANFGRQHHFAIGHPQIVGGEPRFQYSGYSFEVVDPWPVGWAYTDDVYVDFVDGDYFIFDMLHPGERIAVTVIL